MAGPCDRVAIETAFEPVKADEFSVLGDMGERGSIKIDESIILFTSPQIVQHNSSAASTEC